MITKKETIVTENGVTFHKSLITPYFVFFTDDGDGLMMYFINEPGRPPMQGAFAENTLVEIILDHEWIWASEDMKYNIKCILEENEGIEDS